MAFSLAWLCTERSVLSRRSVAASNIQHPFSSSDGNAGDQLFAAFPHAVRDARKVAFFPQRFVRIHWGCSLCFDYDG
jgi:hypothetical protein